MIRSLFIIAAALASTACADSPTAPDSSTLTTTAGTLEVIVERGVDKPWTNEVDLGAGNWTSASVVSCHEVRPGAQSWTCTSHTMELRGNVMTFAGVKVNHYATVIRVRWEATGR